MHRWSKTPNYRRNIDLIIRASHTPTKGYSGGKRGGMAGIRWRSSVTSEEKDVCEKHGVRRERRRGTSDATERSRQIYVFNIFCRERDERREKGIPSRRAGVWSLPDITHSADIIPSCAPLSVLVSPEHLQRRGSDLFAACTFCACIAAALCAARAQRAGKRPWKLIFLLFRTSWPTKPVGSCKNASLLQMLKAADGAKLWGGHLKFHFCLAPLDD